MSAPNPSRRSDGTFDKGSSGNLRGRPTKDKGQIQIDANAFLNDPIRAPDSKGVIHEMSPWEIAFRQHLKSSARNVRSAAYVLKMFLQYDAVARVGGQSSVVHCPSGMSLEHARLCVERYGPPPWTARQIAAASKPKRPRKQDDGGAQ